MRLWTGLILILQLTLVVAAAVVIGSGRVPLGVPREWEWLRVEAPPPFDGLVLAGLGVAAFAAFVAVGYKLLALKASWRIEAACVTALLGASLAIQVTIPLGAASGYDLAKWAAVNYLPGSAGYFKVARQQAVRDPWKFLANYPRWIRDQDSLHIGTHPPGLIASQCVLMAVMERYPGLTDFLIEHMPATVDDGFRVFGANDPQPLTRGDRATLYATAILTLLACSSTVVPLYLLARASLPARASWAAAALWPLVPAANLFQPVADTAYPLLATTALALAAWSARLYERPERPARTALALALASGAVMAFGMFFTLAFLPVGLIVALIVCFRSSISWKARGSIILATGLGFLVPSVCGWTVLGANPIVVSSWNLHHHARFYDEYPRTYRIWLLVNPIELAIAVSIPTSVWCLCGLFAWRNVPAVTWATLLVLTLTNLTGRNMGEVARLWMLYTPPLLVGAGFAYHRWESKASALAVTLILIGLETLALQAMIQVVYPV